MSVFDETMGDIDGPGRPAPSPSPVTSPVTGPLALGWLTLSLLTVGLVAVQASGPGLVVGALGPYALIATFVRRRFDQATLHHFGPANAITLLRAVLNVFVLGLVVDALGGGGGDQGGGSAGTAWIVASLATVSLALDGVDGHLARRARTASAFGARFDVEVDALLLVVLALAAVVLAEVGVWVLTLGLAYYAFLAAQTRLPWLRQPLPPSFARKAVFVAQAMALLALMLPPVASTAATVLAAAALAAMTLSFARDVLWLARERARRDADKAADARP